LRTTKIKSQIVIQYESRRSLDLKLSAGKFAGAHVAISRNVWDYAAGEFAGEMRVLTSMSVAISLFPTAAVLEHATQVGFRFGAKGTHTSRTMMLEELTAVLAAVPHGASREDYSAAVVEGNCLRKATAATRRLTNQRLGELYGLDPRIPLFRVLRRLWSIDVPGRSLLALQCAIARDPLLAATVAPVLALAPGNDLQRDTIRSALREAVDERLSDATLDKVIRNVASSWEQAGHLVGRTFKKRVAVQATPGSVAFGLYLGHAVGFRGAPLFAAGWISLLDCTPARARELAVEAKRIGLIDLRIAGEVVDMVLNRLDSTERRT
jgi:hypothetical protein